MAFNEQDKKSLQVGFFLVLLIVVGALVFKFQINELTKNQILQETEQINNQINEQKALRNDLQNLRDHEAEIIALQESIEEASRRLPNTPEARDFYERLTLIIGETKLDWDRLSPIGTREYQMYTEYPYDLVAQASYHDFGGLLNLVETDPERFMRISGINITTQQDNPTLHQMHVEITTFMLQGEGV